ncbi:nitrate reductase molybdenum cofactor assembly chaperone [Parasphingorhabdus halotolerans]|uniref:Nitrate reductase molybdenum cofactor assembly chaperone n=1 Tax=Parasphingorhabdus halotolerans TaxID=2725558 RepID=A0A6H2DRL9_9SPHN|nr:nitrate reductase molybdenum cofactor assembly chaperone [Parasphingorhabdus halotolerans]QJB70306.1 nitrate reductase molybdenum cofactor assembly chaperone [Parasphingorhabdus halotolerans]
MTKTFKILAALLTYPTAEIQEAVDDFLPLLKEEGMLPAAFVKRLNPIIAEYRERDLLDLQERYVLLFDRTRSLSLHLFEHVHGESRDRGQAMVDLKSMYEEKGLLIDSTELPDFLPLFLEFLSILPPAEALELLSEPAHVIAAVGERLAKRDSCYAAVLGALGQLSGPADAEVIEALRNEPDDDPDDLEALDEAWEAEQVTFGPGSPEDGCPKVSDMLGKMLDETPHQAMTNGGPDNG